ncbi:MAG: hypothetical protein ACP5G6_08225 [Conexivisphaera sp.]
MRKRLLMIGLVILVVGAAMYFAGPYLARGNVVMDQLLPLRNYTELGPGASLQLGSAPPGMGFAVVYNSTPSLPLAVTVNGTGLSEESMNGTFLAVYYNSGPSSAPVALVDNYTSPVSVHYSAAALSVSGIIYSVIFVLLGGVLIIVGGVTALVGLVLRPRRTDAPAPA